MKRQAVADTRAGRVFVTSWWTSEGKYPLLVQGDWVEAAEEPVGDEMLGGLVRSALASSRDGVPVPDFRNDPEWRHRRGKLLKLAGVRSETQYARGTRSVSVQWDDAQPDIEMTPFRNGGRRDGFTEMPDQVIIQDAAADDAALGAAVRRALAVATDET